MNDNESGPSTVGELGPEQRTHKRSDLSEKLAQISLFQFS